jgi:hypothetical protein
MRRLKVLALITALLVGGSLLGQNTPRYKWASSFAGPFFEDKFNFLEITRVFYQLPEPLVFKGPGVRQDVVLGYIFSNYYPTEDEVEVIANHLLFGMSRLHRDLWSSSFLTLPVRLSVFAGGGLGYSAATNGIDHWNPFPDSDDLIDKRIGYFLTGGGRLELGPIFAETSWNLRDAKPQFCNTISLGCQSKSPLAAFVVPVIEVAVFLTLAAMFGGMAH